MSSLPVPFLVCSTLTLALFTVPVRAQTREAAAEALYEAATKAFEAKDYATACPKLEEVVKLVPYGVGGRLTLARCYEATGKLASAYAGYMLAEGLAATAKKTEMQQQAHDGAEALRPKLARLTILVPEGVHGVAELAVQRDGVLVGAAQWGVPIPLDKGEHRVVVTAPGKRTWEKVVAVDADGASLTVSIDPLADDIPERPPAPPPVAVVPVPPGDAPQRPVSLSHRRQLGAVLRVDIDGQGRGAIAAPGLSYGIVDYVDLTACALLGRDKGVEPGATLLFLRGAWKPRLTIATPIFVVGGPRPGVRVAAGVQWDPLRHLGVFVDAGVTFFPTVPEGMSPQYQRVVFVPSVGLQPRL